LKTQNRMAGDENGFITMTIIILIVLIIVAIVLIYLWPLVTIGAMLCVGALFLLFNGTMEPKYAAIMLVAGAAIAAIGVFL
jgi:uncharacterized membrane protein (DUF106 family)